MSNFLSSELGTHWNARVDLQLPSDEHKLPTGHRLHHTVWKVVFQSWETVFLCSIVSLLQFLVKSFQFFVAASCWVRHGGQRDGA